MFHEFRPLMFDHYCQARRHFIAHPEELIELEQYTASLVSNCLRVHYREIEKDYNEASFLYPFWANYPPDDRGRAPVGDQVPWIEVGEHAVGHKLSRLISQQYDIAEVGLPSGADNRFVLWSDEIDAITRGLTSCVFVFLDIKSVGPRDNSDHTVISPYQVSGDGIWEREGDNLVNSPMVASGTHVSHPFYPAISPIYVLSDEEIAPAIHLFVKPEYRMLSSGGQPLKNIKTVCVPNGLLLTENPNYLQECPRLFFPGKDDKGKDPRKSRIRVSFPLLRSIAPWRVQEISATG